MGPQRLQCRALAFLSWTWVSAPLSRTRVSPPLSLPCRVSLLPGTSLRKDLNALTAQQSEAGLYVAHVDPLRTLSLN